MRSRSWMAAWTLASLFSLGVTAPSRAGDDPVVNTVKLDVQIAGIGRKGCDVEIRPAHPGCRFEPVVRHSGPVAGSVYRMGTIAIEAESINADRDCTFAITIREPGQPAKTFRRGVRLTPKTVGRPSPVQSLSCFLSSPSLAARDEASRPRR